MSNVDAKKIEEYQLILLKNPRSKVFAALAEAYRKMDLLEEAIETCRRGLQFHPDYVSGLVALAKILFQKGRYSEALSHLEKALSLRPENLLANRLLAHCYIKLKQQEKALKAYKKLLFFNPNDEKAINFVKKWEFLENQKFDLNSLPMDSEEYPEWIRALPDSRDLISVVDVCIAKEMFTEAEALTQAGQERWSMDPELHRRFEVINRRQTRSQGHQHRKRFWEKVLHRIERRKLDPLRSL